VSPARADDLTALALLNCVIREVSGPTGRVRADGPHVLIELPRTGRTLRAAVRRPALGEPRLTGRVEHVDGERGWSALAWDEVVAAVDAELGVDDANGAGSALAVEIAASHAFISEVLRRRPATTAPDPGDRLDLTDSGSVGSAEPVQGYADYLESEQSLIAGHRFHPAPKARSGSAVEALRYAPETRSVFPLRYLAVPDELLWQQEAYRGGVSWLDRVLADNSAVLPPSGHRLLPLHPWQFAILSRGTALPEALAAGQLVDLGERGRPVRPTSSVRTVDTGGSGFLKLSLAVQITNCLRVNPRPELTAAVTVTRLMEPAVTELMKLFPGTVVLPEPAVRTVDLEAHAGLGDQLGVIAREGLSDHLQDDVRPLLAAAFTEPWPDPAVTALLGRLGAVRDDLIGWWDEYLARLLPPVLHAFFAHGLVFEAHLQNVVIGLGTHGADRTNRAELPIQLVLRDLEGVKLVGPRHNSDLAALPAEVREHLTYTPERGWDRVAYCLFVNHVSGVLAVLADRDPGAERLLWSRVRHAVTAFRREHGDAPQLRAVLAGMPLPAKTNLLTRWHRDADRDSGYVPVSLPLGPSLGVSG
jgi:siderophore synthetase component